MKHYKFSILVLMTILFVSCTPSLYYQVYKVESDQANEQNNKFVFENEDCIISYNYWGEGGDAGFGIYNKTNLNIYINKEECFFIMNGLANNYFLNRTFTHSSSNTIATGKTASGSSSASITALMYNMFYGKTRQSNEISYSVSASEAKYNTNGYSEATNEEKTMVIPPKSMKILSEYKVTSRLFDDCDLPSSPSRKKIKTITFKQENSPYIFSNVISYRVGKEGKQQQLENIFFIRSITNLPKSEMIENIYNEKCGSKSLTPTEYFKNPAPNKFYLKYKSSKTFDESSSKKNSQFD